MEEEYVLINEFQASTIRRYLSDLSKMSNDLPNLNLPDDWWKMNPKIVASFKQQLQQVFLLPKLNDENQICISKSQLLQPFLSFLVQLLYHKSSDVRFENLEKELRFLLTILGDISWLLPDTNDAEFNNLMAEFESVANQAGCFLHSLFFSNVGSREMYEGLAAVLLSIHLLKETLNSSDIITPAYATPRTSTINSFLILYSLLNDLEDLLKREDNPIANVKDQIYLLHQGLQFLRSSSIRSSKLSEIGELKELLMRMGDLAHQVEYLITAFLVGDAPLWYVIKRLTYLTHNIEVTSKELQGTIAERDKFGGLKLIKKFSLKPPSQDKTSSEACDVVVGFDDKERDILDQLVGGGTESLQVILIWGMPGLGKTTLAKKLYNHPLVTYRFDRLSWCTISQSYDRRSILCDILIHVNSELGKDVILKMEEMKLEEHIYKTLKGRRYLVTMDDVWDSNVSHDLLRDLCLKISGEENFIKFSKNRCFSVFEKSHRVQAANDVSATPSFCQHVRSFYGNEQRSCLYVGDMRILRVLHFNRIFSDCVLFGMEYLVNLRFLVIPKVPTWIDRFVKLEYLTVHSAGICSLPPSIGKMKKLRYLKAIGARYGEDWNSRETNMSLHYLSVVNIQNSKDVELLRCSPNLRKLKCGHINPKKLESVNQHFDLSFLTQLHSLGLKLYGCKLEEFGFPSNIRKLNLWVGEKLSWEEMSIIGKLENLQFLKLSQRYLGEEGEELWDTRDGEFQSLRLLRLDFVTLSQWNVASCQHFPKLQHLILRNCWCLKDIPSEIGEITTLESIQVSGKCPDTLTESARRIEQDQRDQGNEDLRVIIT